MPTPAELATWPFLSIVAWPDGWDRHAVAGLLTRFAVLDPPTLNLRLGRPPPMVLDRVDPSAAAQAIAALIEAGGDGFTFTLDDLARLGSTMRIKDLWVAEGALDLELHEGVRAPVGTDAVDVLVRARIGSTVTTHEPVSLTAAPAAGRTRSWDSIKAEIESRATRDVRVRELLDVHTTDGSVYRIDGHRFGYRALGAMRGYADKANMDAMCELLAHLCPDAVVDTYYEIWRPPPGYRTLRLPRAKGRRDDPAFAFYSRWAALTYRHARGNS